jgi:hypothetical protein
MNVSNSILVWSAAPALYRMLDWRIIYDAPVSTSVHSLDVSGMFDARYVGPDISGYRCISLDRRIPSVASGYHVLRYIQRTE